MAGKEGGLSETPDPLWICNCFAVVFVSENLVCSSDDIMTFKSLQLTPF